ncbi:MAG: 1-deoxy-D-xylulose-5-phosphate reductoisomerase [Oscillospiraceae bacterium]|nr:1-deoxy-D-xylulose-5-phosphate reductoisomerase [Oscillospiraceae bacterium]
MEYLKTISILGSTGSIGTQALEIAKKHNIRVIGVAAKSNVDLLIKQAKEFECRYVCIYDEDKLDTLKAAFEGTDVKIYSGMNGLCMMAVLNEADIILNSVVGMVGLQPTLFAIEAGKDIALANKETLVAGGQIVTEAAKRKGVTIYPVDSEHSAIFQCLQGNDRKQLSKIILTASGGPFYKKTKDELREVSIEQALNHPNWAMGKKITIDSATLMNKGLEFIEAIWLFDLKPEQIEIIVQRESVIHSAVEYNDHSVIAQMGVPDMKIPIQYALLYPERVDCPTKPLSLADYGTLSFGKPDFDTFDCLSACIKAITMGGAMPAMVNGANEEAVAQFLAGNISFLSIGELVMSVTNEMENCPINNLDDVLRVDKAAREFVKNKISQNVVR